MTTAIGTLEHKRGESIVFGLRATDPAFDGAEVVTCDVKLAENGGNVPAASAPVVLSITPTFVAAAGEAAAYWRFVILPAQSATLANGNYITDAKIIFAGGVVDIVDPIVIEIDGAVTA